MNKQTLNLLLIVVVVLLTLWACEDVEKFDPKGERYLPLQVGNYWKLAPENILGSTLEITVSEQVTIHDKIYYKLHTIAHEDAYNPREEVQSYFRIDENDFIYHLSDSASNIEVNVYRLGAPHGYQWNISGTDVFVRKKTEVVNGHTLMDCKTFFFNDPSGPDDEHSVTFAPGVGYLKIDGGFGRLSQLAFAKINGAEYDFR